MIQSIQETDEKENHHRNLKWEDRPIYPIVLTSGTDKNSQHHTEANYASKVSESANCTTWGPGEQPPVLTYFLSWPPIHTSYLKAYI